MGEIAGSTLERLTQSMAGGVEDMLTLFTTMWLKVPSPDPRQSAVTQTQEDLAWITLLVAACGLLIAVVRVGMKASMAEGIALPRMYLVMAFVTSAGGLVVAQLLQAGDQFSPWLVNRATSGDFGTKTQALITASMLTNVGVGPGLILGTLAVVSSALQIVAMFVRSALLLVLMAWLPTVAAASGTEAGMHRLKQVCAWIFAVVIYKPVSAVIYAVGFRILQQDRGGLTEEIPAAMHDLILGMTIVLMAVIALPALIKFLVPIAARAGSGVSPAAALGTVAAGAAVVTGVIATGGATAPAAGAAVTTMAGARGNNSSGGTASGARTSAAGAHGASGTSGAPGPAGNPGAAGASRSAAGSSGGRTAAAGAGAATGALRTVERSAQQGTGPSDDGGASGATNRRTS